MKISKKTRLSPTAQLIFDNREALEAMDEIQLHQWLLQMDQLKNNQFWSVATKLRVKLNQPSYITQSSVLEQTGWSKKKLTERLGKPDLIRDNPNYATAAPMKLYLTARVIRAQGTERKTHG